MWFKNLVFYRFTRPFDLDAETLAAQLEQHRFGPCRAQELSSYGWTSPMAKLSDQPVHSGNGSLLICAQKEDKLLPASVIRDFLNERVELIETEQQRKVRKKEKDELKDEIIIDLLPKAFSRYQQTHAYIDPKLGLLVIDASSAKRAEELCAYLRQTLGSLPVSIPALHQAPTSIMTRWLLEEESMPVGFELGDESELKDPSENGATLRCKQQDLLGDEMRPHLDAGKMAVKLALSWRDSCKMILGEDLILRRLKFSETLLDQAADAGAEDAAAAFDADFFLMTETLAKLIPEVLEALGGENQDAYQSAITSS
ncbi:MAG: recombination associated protein RdgC [Motiliproteus sp.]|jgi:recombination associated protein RdgC